VRLVSLLLIGFLGFRCEAQSARVLPWEGLPAPFWQGLFEDLPDSPPPPPALSKAGDLWVRLGADGGLAVVDSRGVIRLRAGLPGRPIQVWRDGGIPVPAPWSRIPFAPAAANPLFLETFWNQGDPRRGLSGLLWIQDDGERILSLVHPATGKVAFLPLPEGAGVDLSFLASGLAAAERPLEGAGQGRRVRRWILPWVALVPVLARLAPPADPPRAGTALQPFPREKGW
jgi:hypothetical protein